jgi:hypothetical protein
MARSDNVPRGRGRPKADRRTEIDAALCEWLKIGPGWDGLVRAVRIVVPQSVPSYKVRREALRDALRNCDRAWPINRALLIARERGVPVPLWAEAERAEAAEKKRQYEALAAAMRRLVGTPALDRLIPRPALISPKRLKQLSTFQRSMHRLFPDLFILSRAAPIRLLGLAYREVERVLRAVEEEATGKRDADPPAE